MEFDGNNFLAVFSFVVDDFLRNSRSSERQEFVFKKSYGDNLRDKDVFIELVKAGVVKAYESDRVEARVYDWRSDRIEKPLLLLFKCREFPVSFESAKSKIPKITKSKFENIPRNPQCSISDELANEFNRILNLVDSNKILQAQQLKSEVGYSNIDDAYFNLLLKILGYDDRLPKKTFDKGLISTINQRKEEEVEKYSDDDELVNDLEDINATTNLNRTEKLTLIKARIGQGKFRDDVIKLWKKCAVSEFEKTEFLIASHILPWKNSDNEQRLSPYNGLLLLPNHDKMFDKGYISFDDNGSIILSNKISEKEFEQLGIRQTNRLFKVENKTRNFLKKHREIFKEILYSKD